MQSASNMIYVMTAQLLLRLTLKLNCRFEELTNSIKQLKNHKKIKDISKVLTGLCGFFFQYKQLKNTVSFIFELGVEYYLYV